MPYKKEEKWQTLCFTASLVLSAIFALGVNQLKSDYIYEANQDLYDLQTNSSGSTGLGSNDDSVSGAFDLGFTFNFYGNDYTQARMATNGCLHFNLTGSYCGDFTPDPLPQYTNTLFVFWTDLIKDNGSAMKAKAFEDYTIFGWYNMREYNRANSDNSLEVWLYPNNTYEYRYGELDIISHDVLIGEQGPTTSDIYTYLFYDECNTGTTNVSGTCVNTDWNNSTFNTLLEDGGSLYGDGTDQSACVTTPLTSVNCAGYAAAYLVQQCALNSLHSENCEGYAAAYFTQQCGLSSLYDEDCTGYATAYLSQQCGLNTLYDSSCTGYAAAYLTQQCGLNDLYSSSCEGYAVAYLAQQCGLNDLYNTACPNYDTAYRIQQCDEDAQYSPTCNGYIQDTVTTYYVEDTTDYGYVEDIWIDDEPYADMYFTDAEWYEIDPLPDFNVIDAIYDIQVFDEPEFLLSYDEFERNDVITINPSEELIEEFIFQETVLVEDFEQINTFIEFETIEELEEWFEEEIREEIAEERTEEAEEELYAEEEVVEEIFEEIEEQFEEEERVALEEREEEVLEEEETELIAEERTSRSGITSTMLNVVGQSIRTASNSNTSSGSSSGGYSSGSSSSGSSSSVNSSAVSSSVTGGGISTSSSPSMSDQIVSANVQTNTILSLSQDTSSMSGGSSQTVSSVSTVITPMPTFDNNPQVVMADVQVSNMQGEIDTAVSGVMTASEADQIADEIIANNIKEQQEQAETEQQETGQYADESTLIAYLGYVPAFEVYKTYEIPKQETWYQSKDIYNDINISDNVNAFYSLASNNISLMNNMIGQQPNL